MKQKKQPSTAFDCLVVTDVDTRLQKAEKSAKEQDNHHYYKIFAEGVKTLLDSI